MGYHSSQPRVSLIQESHLSFLGLLHWQVDFLHFPVQFGDDNGTPLQYSCLDNPMERGAWWAAVHGVTESTTRLSDFTFTFHFHALEKEMATHSSVLAWRIPGTGEPGGLPSRGSNRVRHDWSDLAAAAVQLRKPLPLSKFAELYSTKNKTQLMQFKKKIT